MLRACAPLAGFAKGTEVSETSVLSVELREQMMSLGDSWRNAALLYQAPRYRKKKGTRFLPASLFAEGDVMK